MEEEGANSATCHACRSYLPRFWQRRLYVGDAEQALAGGVDGEASKVAAYPAAVELFGNGGSGAGTAEAIEDESFFIGRCLNDSL